MEHERHLDIVRGIFGTVASFMTLAVAHMEEVEAWLRIISLLVGITVGLLTIWKILRKKKGG